MDLIPGVFVETCELDSGHPETAILQVTTDKETQKWMSGFLLRIYPQSSITKIRQQNAKMISDGYAQPNDLAQDTPQHE